MTEFDVMKQQLNDKNCFLGVLSAMAKMYLVCGASGCGKTTFARRYIEQGCLYFSPDSYYALINGDAGRRENLFEVWISLFVAIHVAEKCGRDCVVDTNALTVGRRAQFLDWFPGFEHHLVYIEAEEDLRRKNNINRSRTIPEIIMDQMAQELVPVTPGEDLRWNSISFWVNKENHFQPQWVWHPQTEAEHAPT